MPIRPVQHRRDRKGAIDLSGVGHIFSSQISFGKAGAHFTHDMGKTTYTSCNFAQYKPDALEQESTRIQAPT
ncbi:hypothetical protein GCM10009332_15920 [Shewanella gelidii]|uniref:Uncharacterized protein n=1 Tax=Shewanella gelidii TaxID=1642821 RepID=A0A917JR13_9GAMM|nr:hypothetical protein GCM10009332_15920 [Shewanella gelidii]